MTNLYFEVCCHSHDDPRIVAQHITNLGYTVTHYKTDQAGLYFLVKSNGEEGPEIVIERISDLWLASEVVEISDDDFNAAEQDSFKPIGGSQ